MPSQASSTAVAGVMLSASSTLGSFIGAGNEIVTGLAGDSDVRISVVNSESSNGTAFVGGMAVVGAGRMLDTATIAPMARTAATADEAAYPGPLPDRSGDDEGDDRNRQGGRENVPQYSSLLARRHGTMAS